MYLPSNLMFFPVKNQMKNQILIPECSFNYSFNYCFLQWAQTFKFITFTFKSIVFPVRKNNLHDPDFYTNTGSFTFVNFFGLCRAYSAQVHVKIKQKHKNSVKVVFLVFPNVFFYDHLIIMAVFPFKIRLITFY